MKKSQISLIIVLAVVIAGIAGFYMMNQGERKISALYEEALADKEAKEFDASLAKLEQALSLAEPESQWAFKIKDEINIHLPLARIQPVFFEVFISDLVDTVATVETYMQQESNRLRGVEQTDETVVLIERLKSAIEARDQSRLSKLKSFMVQYGQVRSYRYAGTADFAEWIKPHMPDILEMKLVKHKGDFINRIYKHEAEFVDTRHNLRIVLDTDGNELLIEPIKEEQKEEQAAENAEPEED